MKDLSQSNPNQRQTAFQNADPSSWLEALRFYEEELKICTCNLEKIVPMLERHPKALPMAEHFQNQFLIQHENIKKLKQQVRRFHQWLKGIALKFGTDKNKIIFRHLKEELINYSAVFNSLILEFKSFFKKEFLISHFTF